MLSDPPLPVPQPPQPEPLPQFHCPVCCDSGYAIYDEATGRCYADPPLCKCNQTKGERPNGNQSS
jgi:hypothetical protein